jgi:hypothetical protein
MCKRMEKGKLERIEKIDIREYKNEIRNLSFTYQSNVFTDVRKREREREGGKKMKNKE